LAGRQILLPGCHNRSRCVVITADEEVSQMANVSLIDQPSGLIPRVAAWYGRRRFGRDVEPVQAASHHSGVLVAAGLLESAVEKGWTRLDRHLALLAVQASSGQIGCSWCVDFGYYENLQKGQDPAKVRDVTVWRDSEVYTDKERVVLEYAEAASRTPAVVSDDLVGRLHTHFNQAEIVELAAWVALENYRSRFNAGLGLHSRGFSDTCRVPVTS
jgi:alkylhydroperoxidase family enzyme